MSPNEEPGTMFKDSFEPRSSEILQLFAMLQTALEYIPTDEQNDFSFAGASEDEEIKENSCKHMLNDQDLNH
ncbi:hypothetical protein Tco_0729442 [Tanacetum coccineum]|uniref:Uncharacterized protein n=1 Tax=Tanacetum coccineum TaxID=301880 RepID=A0ABQ4YRA3_9ASTR